MDILWHTNEHATLYSTGLHSFYIDVSNALQFIISFFLIHLHV